MHYQHTIILSYHGQNEVGVRKNLAQQTTQLFEVKVKRIALDGYVYQATNVCNITGSCIFRSPVQISKIMSSNKVLLLAVGAR